jgi:hypothetical protein
MSGNRERTRARHRGVSEVVVWRPSVRAACATWSCRAGATTIWSIARRVRAWCASIGPRWITMMVRADEEDVRSALSGRPPPT